MRDPVIAIQDALVATLSALDTPVGDRVLGQAPLKQKQFPYALVWRGTAQPIDEDCSDRTESIVQIEIFADTETYIQAKAAAGLYRDRLHEQEIDVAGHVVDRCRVEDMTYTLDPPEYGATLTLSIETQPVA